MSGTKSRSSSSVVNSSGRLEAMDNHRPRPRTRRSRSNIGDSRPSCEAVGDNGQVCGETKTLSITAELQSLYENRLKQLDEASGTPANSDQLQVKVGVLNSWVKDLLEQNAELVHTVEELEREMAYRVKLLEEKLRESARACQEYMTNLNNFNMQDMANDKEAEDERHRRVRETEDHLHNRLGNLKSDIANLLKLICQAREEGTWNIDNVVFYEVTPEEIFRCSPRTVQSASSAPVGPGAVVIPLPSKPPRKVKLSLELSLNKCKDLSSMSNDDTSKPNPISYQWTFEPPDDPCRCTPQKQHPQPE